MNSAELLDTLDAEPKTRQAGDTKPSCYEHVALLGQSNASPAILRRESVLSKGKYGLIYRGYLLASKQDVVIKYMIPESALATRGATLENSREFVAMQAAQHNNVIHAVGTLTRELRGTTLQAIVMPYVKYTLSQLRGARVRVGLDCVAYVAYSLLEALRYLHEELNLIHGDLHPGNILVSDQGRVVITDLGLARPRATYHNQAQSSRICLLWYRAPELILADRYYDVAVDCWSAGVTLLELALGYTPIKTTMNADHEGTSDQFRRKLYADLFTCIFDLLGEPDASTWPFFGRARRTRADYLPPTDRPPTTPTLEKRCRDRQLDAEFIAFIRDLLTYSPALRLQASDGLQHPWLCEKFPVQSWQAICGPCQSYGVTHEPPASSASAPHKLARDLHRAYNSLTRSGQHTGQRLRKEQQRRQRKTHK